MDYDLFSEWLFQELNVEPLPESIVAFCFNIYESCLNNQFDVQLVGCSQFDSDNDDWACSAVFTTGENVFSFLASDWEDALEIINQVLIKAIERESLRDLFKNKHVAYGFVDGDLSLVK